MRLKKRRGNPYKYYLPRVIFWAVVAVILLVVFLVLCGAGDKPAEVSPEIPQPIIVTPAPEIDSSDEAIIQAVIDGDTMTGVMMENPVCTYNQLWELSAIMAAESGPNWPDWAIMAIGEVVMNRVESEDFPDTIHEVLYQRYPVQYEPVWQDSFGSIRPDERTVRLAFDLLKGERVLEDETIVFQALFPQGNETIVTYTDTDLGTTTYFCTGYYEEG